MEVTINFSHIHSIDEFYTKLGEQIDLPSCFGNNLDALYDFITGDAPMPFSLRFTEMKIEQLDTFMELIQTLEEAEEAEEAFDFSYFLS